MTHPYLHVQKKELLRTEIIARRRAEDSRIRAQADKSIAYRVRSLREYQKAHVIFCYISVDAEVDTRALIADMLIHGKTVCAPRCKRKGVMSAHILKSFDELEEGMLGIPAPRADSPLVLPEDIDLVLVPCLTCDTKGCRLGYGGGYYDRYLVTTKKATKLVLCRESLVRGSVPLEAHDVQADILITDKKTVFINCSTQA